MSRAGYFLHRFMLIFKKWDVLRVILKSFFLSGVIFVSCSEGPGEGPEPQPNTGHITIKFTHHVDQQPIQLNTMMYINAAGNPYEVSEVMYFISDVTLYRSDGMIFLIDDWKDIHYVDLDIPSTLTWEVFDDIPEGTYDSITFIFGIPEEKNESFMFVNPPEDKMMWPDILGGGYHYMMINRKWLDEGQIEQLYNFHLGIGQLYKGE